MAKTQSRKPTVSGKKSINKITKEKVSVKKTVNKTTKKTAGKTASGYLHGYTSTEQNRLYHQARFLEDHVFDLVDFSASKHILEVGCGVGAQTEILRERFPKLRITGVDAAEAQIKRATKHLASSIKSGQVKLTKADALALPFPDDSFDGCFITWFLEHVADPIAILKEANRTMRHGAVIYCNEVLNNSFFVHPYSPATLQYWFAFNDHQWNLKGDPYVGAKLGNYLQAAGFGDIKTTFSYWHLDNRQPKLRGRFFDYWTDLLLSGAPELEKAGKVTNKLILEMTKELKRLKDDPDSAFFLGFMKARAVVL